MTTTFRLTTLVALCCLYLPMQAQYGTDSAVVKAIYREELTNGKCYQVLDYLCNKIGGRLSGSPQAEQAVDYMYNHFKAYGFDTVYLQEVMVPHWVRGEKEKAMVVSGKQKIAVNICALGNSVGTGSKGIEAPVIEVHGLDELKTLGEAKIKGKIVFFNRPMDPTHFQTGAAYGGAVDQRGRGAMEAAKYGAIGVVVRSMTLAYDEHPHTGAMRYVDSIPKIPACAISTKDADVLSRSIKEKNDTRFYFRQTCEMLPDVKSYNVIAEITGSEKPEEVVICGGHLDSWDNGDGAHDDGAGCVQSMEALRLIKVLGLKPKRTMRAVLFMNEENGVRGGIAYADLAAKTKHIAAIESDAGGYTPRGFGIEDNNAAVAFMQPWITLLSPYGIKEIVDGHGGTDIGPLKKNGTVLIGYMPDTQRYFDIHHASTDTFDKINKRELELGAAAMSALMWLISEHGAGQ